MGPRGKRRVVAAIMAATMIGTASTDAAQAKPPKKPTMSMVRKLQRQVKALDARLTKAEDDVSLSLGLASSLYDCISAIPVDSFTLPGADASIQYPLALSGLANPAYWVAVIDSSCLMTAVAAPVRAFGLRVRRLERR